MTSAAEPRSRKGSTTSVRVWWGVYDRLIRIQDEESASRSRQVQMPEILEMLTADYEREFQRRTGHLPCKRKTAADR